MPETKPPPKADIAQLSRLLMRRQAALSLRVASVFLTMLLGLPLVNYFAPSIASYPILGFPANWLFLGVLFYPITVALSIYFVRNSDKIENQHHEWDTTGIGEDL
jgi:predicted membrane channel-forming protein YqfA (hemolysin III family)